MVRLQTAPRSSCSFHPLPPSWAWTSVFGDFTITCNAWSSSQCMQIRHLHAKWSRMQGERAWVQNWYIHRYVAPPGMRARKVPKGDAPMSKPEKLNVFNPRAPLSSCYCAWLWPSYVVGMVSWQMLYPSTEFEINEAALRNKSQLMSKTKVSSLVFLYYRWI